jgi:Na+/melibiose symporter-like transporter
MVDQLIPEAPQTATTRPRNLWHNWEFTKLWVGQSISTLGSGVTTSALPLTAVLMLDASAADMGWLLAAESAPVLLAGMFAGVWVDRFRRRPLLVGADLGRAVLLLCIPILALLGSLRIEYLFVVAAAVGTLTLLFDVAYRSFVPDLVGPDSVLEANSRLASVEAVAEITTPGLTGALIQVISPATTLLLDAASFIGSAACIGSIRHVERVHLVAGPRESVWSEIVVGLRAVASNPTLRALATWEALRNFFGLFIGALYVLFGLRELGLSPVLVGITVGVGGASNLIGTLVLPKVTRRFGVRRTMVGAVLVSCLSPILIALAPSHPVGGFVVLVAAQALDAVYPLYDVNALTLRQVTTPAALRGRVNATMHIVARGVIPFGAVAGGILGEAVGLRPTLLMAAIGITVSAVWLARSARRWAPVPHPTDLCAPGSGLVE